MTPACLPNVLPIILQALHFEMGSFNASYEGRTLWATYLHNGLPQFGVSGGRDSQ